MEYTPQRLSKTELSFVEDILINLIVTKKIDSYSVNGQSYYLKLTAADDIAKVPSVPGWVDKAVLRAYVAKKFRLPPQSPSPLHVQIILDLNRQIFARCIVKKTAALEVPNPGLREAEKILQKLVQNLDIHAYAKNDRTLYIQLTDADDVSNVPFPVFWVDRDLLKQFENKKLNAPASLGTLRKGFSRCIEYRAL